MASRHRKKSQRRKSVMLVGVASATTAFLTVGAASPMPPEQQPSHAVSSAVVKLAASTGPDYTALIESLSNSTNNILFAQGNIGGALAALLNPVAAASGGLLPSFYAGTSQQDLTSVQGLLNTLGLLLAQPDLGNVPGLPADALPTILSALLPALNPVLGRVTPVLGGLLTGLAGPLATVQGVLTALNALNSLPVVGGVITGIPTLNDLLGLTVSQTSFQSGYSLPLLGVAGSTNVDNTFAQLPSLDLSTLVANLTNSLALTGNPNITLDVPILGLPVNVPLPLSQVVDALTGSLSSLDAISTPSITAWIPAASGNYGLPLGGSVGFLSTTPTLVIGPLNVLNGLPLPPGLIDTTADTVVAIPIQAAGVTLPLGLLSIANVSTPGVVLPTATGVNTLGGASVTAINILGLPVLTLTNIQPANYYGTNGIDVSNGQNIATILGLPIIFLGSFNIGNSGFGFTLPSLFGVGLIPPIQVGTAPTQQSSDGLVGSDLVNLLHSTLRTAVPTQLTSVTQLLGLPDLNAVLAPFLGAIYGATVTPLSTVYTGLLNQTIGTLVNGAAAGFEGLTAALANLSYALPGATQPVVPPAGQSGQPNALLAKAASPKLAIEQKSAGNPVDAEKVVVDPVETEKVVVDPVETEKVVVDPVETEKVVVDPVETEKAADPIRNVQNQLRDANTQITNSIDDANDRINTSVEKARTEIKNSAETASATLNTIAKDGQDEIKKAVDGVPKAAENAANDTNDTNDTKDTKDSKPE